MKMCYNCIWLPFNVKVVSVLACRHISSHLKKYDSEHMLCTQVATSCSHQQALPSRKASSWLHEVPFHEISPLMCTMLYIHENGKK